MKTKQIMLLRHAKAVSHSVDGDFARQLTQLGREHAEKLGQQLLTQKLLPQSIFSSSAVRAVETTQLVCAQLAIDLNQVTVRDELYLADIDEFLSLLKQLDKRINRVMLVAHNPALEDLVNYLCKATAKQAQTSSHHMSPATLLMLEFKADWADLTADSCALAQRIDGKLL